MNKDDLLRWTSKDKEHCLDYTVWVWKKMFGYDVEIPKRTKGPTKEFKSIMAAYEEHKKDFKDRIPGDAIIATKGKLVHIGVLLEDDIVTHFQPVKVINKKGEIDYLPAKPTNEKLSDFARRFDKVYVMGMDSKALFKYAEAGIDIAALLLQAIIAAAVNAVVGYLFRPARRSSQYTQNEQTSTNYTFAGASNDINPYGVMLYTYGRDRVVMPFGSIPYTIFQADDDANFNALLHLGIGNIRATDWQIGDTPISDFRNIALLNVTGKAIQNDDGTPASIGDRSLFGFNRVITGNFGGVSIRNRRTSFRSVSSETGVNSVEVKITSGQIASITAEDIVTGETTSLELPDTYTETDITGTTSYVIPGFQRGGNENGEYIPPRTVVVNYTYPNSGNGEQTFTLTTPTLSIITVRLQAQNATITFRDTNQTSSTIETNTSVEEGAELVNNSATDFNVINRTINGENVTGLALNFTGQLYGYNSSGVIQSNQADIGAYLINPTIAPDQPRVEGPTQTLTGTSGGSLSRLEPRGSEPGYLLFTYLTNQNDFYFEYNGQREERFYQVAISQNDGGFIRFRDITNAPDRFRVAFNGVILQTKRSTSTDATYPYQWDLGVYDSQGNFTKTTPSALSSQDELWDPLALSTLPAQMTLGFPDSGWSFVKRGSLYRISDYVNVLPRRITINDDGDLTITNSRESQLQVSLRTDRELPLWAATNPRIRVLRTKIQTSTNRNFNRVRLQEIITFKASSADHEYQNRVALSIRADETANGVVSRISAIIETTPDHQLPVKPGSTYTKYSDTNPANAYYNTLRGGYDDEGVYGPRLKDRRIDIGLLQDWAEGMEPTGIRINGVLDTDLSVRDLLNSIAESGQGIPTNQNGTEGVIWDEPAKPAIADLTRENTKSNTRISSAHLYPPLYSRIPVRYKDEDKNYEQQEFIYEIPGADPSLDNAPTLELLFTRTRAEAEFLARIQVDKYNSRNRQLTIEVGQEFLNLAKGDVIIFRDPTMRTTKPIDNIGNTILTDKAYFKIIATEPVPETHGQVLTCILDESNYGNVYNSEAKFARNRVWTASDAVPPTE